MKQNIIKLFHAIYTGIDTSTDEGFYAVQVAIKSIMAEFGILWIDSGEQCFFEEVNCKHFENASNFQELCEECMDFEVFFNGKPKMGVNYGPY
jgi:hypothetical protein